MKKIYYIALIIISTILSIYNAIGISLFFLSPSIFAQVILFLFAIFIVFAILKNKIQYWVIISFTSLHILIAGFQSFMDSVVIFTILEIILYILVIFLFKKVEFSEVSS